MFQTVGEGVVGTVLFFADVEENWPVQERFASYVATYAVVRHEHCCALFGERPTLLLARLSLAGNASMRTFVLVEGPGPGPDIPPEVRWTILDQHGILTASGVRDVRGTVGRNDRCPCRSGQKYKRCHAATLRSLGTATS